MLLYKVDTEGVYRGLIDEYYFLKPTSNVKKMLMVSLSLIIRKLEYSNEDMIIELKTLIIRNLDNTFYSDKPDLSVIEGSFKALKYLLNHVAMHESELQTILKYSIVGIQKIKDVTHYKIIKSALKLFSKHIEILIEYLKGRELELFNLVLDLFKNTNRRLKEKASNFLVSLCYSMAKVVIVNLSESTYTDLLDLIVRKLRCIIQKEEDPLVLITCIKAYGSFSGAICQLEGVKKLHNHFYFLIENSQASIFLKIDKIENFHFEKNPQNFKSVLFNQKMLIGYLASFAFIIIELDDLETTEIKFLTRIITLSLKHLLNYFPPYKKALTANLSLLLNSLPGINYTSFIYRTFINEMASNVENKCDFTNFESLKVYYDFFEMVLTANLSADSQKRLLEEFIKFLTETIDKKDIKLATFSDSALSFLKDNKRCFGCHVMLMFFEKILHIVELKSLIESNTKSLFTLFKMVENKLETKQDNFLYTRCFTILMNFDTLRLEVLQNSKTRGLTHNTLNYLTHNDEVIHNEFFRLACFDFSLTVPTEIQKFGLPEICHMLYNISKNKVQCKSILYKGLTRASNLIESSKSNIKEMEGAHWIQKLKVIANTLRSTIKEPNQSIFTLVSLPNIYPHQEILELIPLVQVEDAKNSQTLITHETNQEVLYVNFELLNKTFNFNLSAVLTHLTSEYSLEFETPNYHAILTYIIKYLVYFNNAHKRGPDSLFKTLDNCATLLCKMVSANSTFVQTQLENTLEVLGMVLNSPHIIEIITLKLVKPLVDVAIESEQPHNILSTVINVFRDILAQISPKLKQTEQFNKHQEEFMNYLQRADNKNDYIAVRINLEIMLLICQNELVDMDSNKVFNQLSTNIMNQLLCYQALGPRNHIEFGGLIVCLGQLVCIINGKYDKLNLNPIVSSGSMEIEEPTDHCQMTNSMLSKLVTFFDSFEIANASQTFGIASEIFKLKPVKDVWSCRFSNEIGSLNPSSANINSASSILVWLIDNFVLNSTNKYECITTFEHTPIDSPLLFILIQIMIDSEDDILFEKLLAKNSSKLVDIILKRLAEINSKRLKNLLTVASSKNPDVCNSFVYKILELLTNPIVLFNFDINDTSIRRILKLVSKYILLNHDSFRLSKHLTIIVERMYMLLKEKTYKKSGNSTQRKKFLLQFLLRIERFDYEFILDTQVDNSQLEYRTTIYNYIKRSNFKHFDKLFYQLFLLAYNDDKLGRFATFLENLELEIKGSNENLNTLVNVQIDFIDVDRLNEEAIGSICSISMIGLRIGLVCKHTNQTIHRLAEAFNMPAIDTFKVTSVILKDKDNSLIFSSILSEFKAKLDEALLAELENVSDNDLNEFKNNKITDFVQHILNAVISSGSYQYLSILFPLLDKKNTNLIESFTKKLVSQFESFENSKTAFSLIQYMIETWMVDFSETKNVFCGVKLLEHIIYPLLNFLELDHVTSLVELYFNKFITIDPLDDIHSNNVEISFNLVGNMIEFIELSLALLIQSPEARNLKAKILNILDHLETFNLQGKYNKEISSLYSLYFNMQIVDLTINGDSMSMQALLNYENQKYLYEKVFSNEVLTFQVLTNFNVSHFSNSFKWFSVADKHMKDRDARSIKCNRYSSLINTIKCMADLEVDDVNSHSSVSYLQLFMHYIDVISYSDSATHQLFARLSETPNRCVNTHVLKVIINSPSLFESQRTVYAGSLAAYLVNKNYSPGFHYFMRDICCLLIKWFEPQTDSLPISDERMHFLHKKLLGCLADQSDLVGRNNLEIYKKFLNIFKKNNLVIKLNDIEQLIKDRRTTNEVNLWKTCGVRALEYIIDLDYVVTVNGAALQGEPLFEHILNNYLILLVNMLQSNCKALLLSIASFLGMISNKKPDCYSRIADELYRYLKSQNMILNEKILSFFKVYVSTTSEAKHNNSRFLQLILNSNMTITVKAKVLVLKISKAVIESGEIDHYIIEESLGYINNLLKSSCNALICYGIFGIVQVLCELSKFHNYTKLADVCILLFDKLKASDFEIKVNYVTIMIKVLNKMDTSQNIEYVSKLSNYLTNFNIAKLVVLHMGLSCEFKSVIEVMRAVTAIKNAHFANVFFIYMCSLKALNSDLEKLGFRFTDSIGKQKEAVNQFNTLSYDKGETFNTFSDSFASRAPTNNAVQFKAACQTNDNLLTQQFVYQDSFYRFNKSNTHIMPLTLKKSYYKLYQNKPFKTFQTTESFASNDKAMICEPNEHINLSGLLFDYSFQNKKLAEEISTEFISNLYNEMNKSEKAAIFRLFLTSVKEKVQSPYSPLIYKFLTKSGVGNIEFTDIDLFNSSDRHLAALICEERIKLDPQLLEHVDKRVPQTIQRQLSLYPDSTHMNNVTNKDFANLNELYQSDSQSSNSTGLLSFLKTRVSDKMKNLVENLETGFDEFLSKVIQDPYLRQSDKREPSEVSNINDVVEDIVSEAHKKALFYCQKWTELKNISSDSSNSLNKDSMKKLEMSNYLSQAFLYDVEKKDDLKEFFSHQSLSSNSDDIDNRYCKELLFHHVSTNSIQHAKYFSFILRDQIISAISDLSSGQQSQLENIGFNAHIYSKCSKFFNLVETGTIDFYSVNNLTNLSDNTSDMKNILYDYNLSKAVIATMPLLTGAVDLEVVKTHEAILELNLVSRFVKVNQLFLATANLKKTDDYYYIIKDNEALAYKFVSIISKIAAKTEKLKRDDQFTSITKDILDQMSFLSTSDLYWTAYEILKLRIATDDISRTENMPHRSVTDIGHLLDKMANSHNQTTEIKHLRKLFKLSRVLLQKMIDAKTQVDVKLLKSALNQYLLIFNTLATRTGKNDLTFLFRLIDLFEILMSELLQEIKLKIDITDMITWIPQLMDRLDSHLGFFAGEILQSILLEYPQMIAHHLYYYRDASYIIPMITKNKEHLDEYFRFFNELSANFYDPELIMEDQLALLKPKINDFDSRQKFIDFFDTLLENKSPIYKIFVQRTQDNLRDFTNSLVQRRPETEILEKLELLRQKAADVFRQKYSRRNFHISAFSSKLSSFTEHFSSLRYFNTKNVTIVDVLKQLTVIGSLRKPKCMSFFCSDGKIRKILLKTGEDLRADSRILNFNQLTNNLIKNNRYYFEINPSQLKIFNVLPLGHKIGIIEWIESSTLKEVLESTIPISETPAMGYRKHFLSQISPDMTAAHLSLFSHDTDTVISEYDKEVKTFGQDRLKQEFMSSHDTAESYYNFKKRFEVDYAIQCALGYILGIGDRHLDNILITKSSKQIFNIDFNCCFNSGVHLKVPELMPFRLTPNLINLMLPFGVIGNFKATMSSILQLIFEHNWLYMDYLSIYVKEPIDNWMDLESPNQQARSDFAIEAIKRKLKGHNPKLVLLDELRSSKHANSDQFNEIIEVVRACKLNNEEDYLGLKELSEALIKISTNKSLLGRSWIGWMPFV